MQLLSSQLHKKSACYWPRIAVPSAVNAGAPDAQLGVQVVAGATAELPHLSHLSVHISARCPVRPAGSSGRPSSSSAGMYHMHASCRWAAALTLLLFTIAVLQWHLLAADQGTACIIPCFHLFSVPRCTHLVVKLSSARCLHATRL